MASGASVVTLDDFDSLLPQWRSDSPDQLYAIVDMGSNGIRFSITDLSPPHTRLLKCVYRERAGISLFDALSSSPSETLPPETVALVAATISRFRRIADTYGVSREHFTILATEAMRRANNAVDMLDAINREAGVGVHVLAPEVETLFGAVMGSRSLFGALERGGLFLDLGGGSMQMTWVDTTTPNYEIEAALAGVSMPFGAARLIRILENPDAEVRTTERGRLRTSLNVAFANLCERFSALAEQVTRHESRGDGVDVYFCGGGFRGYGSMLMHTDAIQPYPIPSVGAYTVSGEMFRDAETMRKVNDEFKGKIFGMSKRRRRQFPAVLEVIRGIIEEVPDIRTATFCTGSNREGMLLMRLPPVLRESDPLTALASTDVKFEEISAVEAALDVLQKAIPNRPDDTGLPTVFSLGLVSLFFPMIWGRMGEDEASNAALWLHNAVTRDPSAPGLSHLARAVLGMTAAARWGGNLGPLDAELHSRLKAILDRAHDEAYFWAEYIGTVAGVMTTFIPARPKRPEDVTNTMRTEVTVDSSGKKPKILLKIRVNPTALNGVDLDDMKETLKDIGKQKGEKRDFKVKAEIHPLS